MGTPTLFLIALGLSMDAFAVSISNGMCSRGFGRKLAAAAAFSALFLSAMLTHPFRYSSFAYTQCPYYTGAGGKKQPFWRKFRTFVRIFRKTYSQRTWLSFSTKK